jgi:hypothetical protein
MIGDVLSLIWSQKFIFDLFGLNLQNFLLLNLSTCYNRKYKADGIHESLPGIDSNPISIYKEHIIPDVSIVPSFLQYQYVTKYVINEEFSATIAWMTILLFRQLCIFYYNK